MASMIRFPFWAAQRWAAFLLCEPRPSASRPSGDWNDDDYDVLADGAVVGRIFKANAAPVGEPWMWTLAAITKIARQRTAIRDGSVRKELTAREINASLLRLGAIAT